MLEISPIAVKEIERLKSNSSTPDSFLRLAVKSGGCSGFFYDLKLENLADTQNGNNANQSLASQDLWLEIGTISIVVDPKSWKYIEHLKIDYSEDLMGGGFRFHNPRVKNVCGCGISFTQANLDGN
jgi:iron-sulfur cluster assembly accessory protein